MRSQRLAPRTAKPVPPGPRGYRLLEGLLDVRRDKLRFVSRVIREYGDIVFFLMGPMRPVYLLSDPGPIQHVLHENAANYVKGPGLEEARLVLGEGILTSQGELWATQREKLHPLFSGKRLEVYAGAIVQATEDMIGKWRVAAGIDQPVDVARDAICLALDILGRTVLGTDLKGLSGGLTSALDEVVRWSMRRMSAILPLPVSAPTLGNLRCRRAIRELEAITDEILARRSKPLGREDFLSILVEQYRESGEEGRRQRRQELLSLLLAGHDTTASALAWCCHLLATHPEAQRRMREEVMQALPAGTLPTAADLPRLPYTRMVLEEALRLYPPVWMITRHAVAGDAIGDYEIPAGSDVLISVYNLHRHPRLWEAPEEFRPERFAAEHGRSRPANAYLPFGSGPRACLGRGFAFLEAILVLSLIVRSFELSPAPGKPVECEPLLTLRPLNGLFLRLRTPAASPPAPGADPRRRSARSRRN